MATLHGILAELGITSPEREPQHASHWVVDEDFTPEPGKSYELAFGRIPFAGEYRQVLKQVRIDGPSRNDWFDLDEQTPLDLELHEYPVKAFRPLA